MTEYNLIVRAVLVVLVPLFARDKAVVPVKPVVPNMRDRFHNVYEDPVVRDAWVTPISRKAQIEYIDAAIARFGDYDGRKAMIRDMTAQRERLLQPEQPEQPVIRHNPFVE